jgi:hypothetical protein
MSPGKSVVASRLRLKNKLRTPSNALQRIFGPHLALTSPFVDPLENFVLIISGLHRYKVPHSHATSSSGSA